MRRPTKRPIRTKERYILDSLVSVFKGGHWVEEPVETILSASGADPSPNGGEGVSAPENGSCDRTDPNPMGTAYITVIGGLKYDGEALRTALELLPAGQVVIGAGRGAESNFEFLRQTAIRIPADPDRYGKNARKANVEEVLTFAPDSPLLLVGEGERVKQARAWLKRTNWPREVIEIP